MTIVIRTDLDVEADARCPRCANPHNIRDGGTSLQGFRAYDVMNDTFGLLRCPNCGFRAGAAEFRKRKHTDR